MVITRLQANRGSAVFVMLPPDAWTAICEALGINGIRAEATNTLFLENLRESRTCLKLPKRYACRFNGVIRGQVEGDRTAAATTPNCTRACSSTSSSATQTCR